MLESQGVWNAGEDEHPHVSVRSVLAQNGRWWFVFWLFSNVFNIAIYCLLLLYISFFYHDFSIFIMFVLQRSNMIKPYQTAGFLKINCRLGNDIPQEVCFVWCERPEAHTEGLGGEIMWNQLKSRGMCCHVAGCFELFETLLDHSDWFRDDPLMFGGFLPIFCYFSFFLLF